MSRRRSIWSALAAMVASAFIVVAGAHAGVLFNDPFAGATELSAPAASVAGTTEGATAEDGEPAHAGQPAARSVWYRFTAPSDGTVAFDTCSTENDTRVAAYTGASVSALTPVAAGTTCVPSSARRLEVTDGGRISLAVTGGTTYSIAVDGNTSGPFVARLAFEDTRAPETTIVKAPKRKSKKRKATFEFTANEAAAKFECSLNGGSYAACTSPAKVRGKRGKRNRFAVRAIDAAGLVEAEPATYAWKVKKQKRR